jgi:hypothetical protein
MALEQLEELTINHFLKGELNLVKGGYNFLAQAMDRADQVKQLKTKAQYLQQANHLLLKHQQHSDLQMLI